MQKQNKKRGLKGKPQPTITPCTLRELLHGPPPVSSEEYEHSIEALAAVSAQDQEIDVAIMVCLREMARGTSVIVVPETIANRCVPPGSELTIAAHLARASSGKYQVAQASPLGAWLVLT